MFNGKLIIYQFLLLKNNFKDITGGNTVENRWVIYA